MPEITTDTVRHLAGLARIQLSETELEKLTGELSLIVDNVAKVAEVATPDVPATSHPVPLSNVMREDEVRPSFSAEQALSGAPEREGDRFRVAAILDEE